jgi:hypothetical protein
MIQLKEDILRLLDVRQELEKGQTASVALTRSLPRGKIDSLYSPY